MPVIFLSGCGCIMLGAAATAAAGYGVYKGGEAAVKGVGHLAKSGAESTGKVLFMNGTFHTEYSHDLKTVWMAAGRALKRSGFEIKKASCDLLSGEIIAETREKTELNLQLKALDSGTTQLTLRVGVKGSMKTSEMINDMIKKELPVAKSATTQSSTVKEGQP